MEFITFKDCSSVIKSVNPNWNQSWIFIGKTDAETEAPILWPPDVKSWLIRKDPDAGKDWRQEEKGMTEDEMVGWHHWLSGHEFELTWRRWWRTGKPGTLKSVESERVGHNWLTEQEQICITVLLWDWFTLKVSQHYKSTILH